MKQRIILFLVGLTAITANSYSQGTDGVLIDPNNATTRDASAVFQSQSTSQGILVPRMTAAQRGAIPVSAARDGLMVYQTDAPAGFYYYNGATLAWVLIANTTSNLAGVTAGTGLTGGGTSGTITVNAVGDNGLTTNADDIDLGGPLTQAATTITQDGSETFTIANTGTGNTTVNLTSTGDFDVQDNGTSALFVRDDAFVGVGTNAPNSPLTVRTSVATANARTTSLANAIGDVNFELATSRGATTNASGDITTQIGQAYNGGTITEGIRFIRGGGSTDGSMAFITNAGTERMRVASNGNVGIGSNAPGVPLDVVGNIRGSNMVSLTSGNGKGYRFWDSDSYKIHMGNAAEYLYGPVTDYSIKMNMSNTAGRGWTWGVTGATPVAALNTSGAMQVASSFTALGNITNGGFDFVLGNTDQVSRGNSGSSRAIVKDGGNILTINYANDFTGGTRIGSLAGTGSRVVVADANGTLSATTSIGSGIVTGSGTTDYLARWTSASTLGIGATRDNGTDVGIGMAPGTYKLSVSGNTYTSGKYFGHLNVDDTRAANTAPTGYNNEVAFDFKQISVIGAPGSGTYGGLITMAPWGDNSGDASHQLHFNEGGMYWRQGQPDAASWGSWDRVVTESMADADYIQNQYSSAQSANYYISGEAKAKVFNFGHDNQSGSSPTFNDGQFYRRDGQAELAVDDWFYMRDNDATVRISFNTDDGSIRPYLMYDLNNTGYYCDPASTTRLYNMSTLAGFDGYYPSNNAIRMTPNFHFNTPNGYALIVNWDNGSSGATQVLRTTGDNFYVYADGQTFTNNWFRPTGSTGLYFQSYGGGWHMTDATWIRSYNSKNVYVNTVMRADGGVYAADNVRMRSAGNNEYGSTQSFSSYGITLEQGISESGGFHADGDETDIWSPGDGNLLNVWDEDGMILEAYLNGTGAYVNASDMNKKQNIVKVDNALAKVLSLTGYNYEFKLHPDEIAKGETPSMSAGVIAQEVKEVMPELVSEVENQGLYMTYDGLFPYLIEAIKEQQSEIEQLKDRNITASDFGNETISGTEKWIEFSEEFITKNITGNTPIVTVTPFGQDVSLHITETTSTGFRVVSNKGISEGSFNWIAMIKISRISTVKRDVESERLKREKVDEMNLKLAKHFKEHKEQTRIEAQKKMELSKKEMELPAEFKKPENSGVHNPDGNNPDTLIKKHNQEISNNKYDPSLPENSAPGSIFYLK